jgi:hypothetical protein
MQGRGVSGVGVLMKTEPGDKTRNSAIMPLRVWVLVRGELPREYRIAHSISAIRDLLCSASKAILYLIYDTLRLPPVLKS